jgi:HAD superfamily phosphatase
MKPTLIFDMDGVLVDVTESYRETIARTVERFTGALPSADRIQAYKNRGGFNDDWKLTHQIIADAGVEAPFEDVQAAFQTLFLGEQSRDRKGAVSSPPSDALILRERWVARPGVLEKLNEQFRFAIFTGRPRQEAELTLNRFAGNLTFDPMICMGEVTEPKPHPEGLLCIVGQASGLEAGAVFYIGDTVDDARCAREARIPFIGIAAPSNPSYLDLVFLFQAAGAYAIVDDINYLEEVFAS